MIIIDLYSIAGFLVAILATFTFKMWHLPLIQWFVAFLLAMFAWPLAALIIFVYRLDKHGT